MPVPVEESVRSLPPILPLPKIYSEDKRVNKPEEYFRFASRYQYLRLLGHGAYGMVCAAMDHQLGYAVAIKRINQINSPLVARRTLRELKLLRHFQGHPNIISIKDLFLQIPESTNFDELFITQELMDADLCHIIQSKYPLSEEHCQRFLYQLLRGLKALHSANVIHRDLKPGNLLWRHNGELRICDFGLARGLCENLEGTDLAMTNYVATRWYRPPEILLYRTSYGKPLDIWSVGCIFAEMLGRKVFLPGQSGFEQLHLILQKLGTPSDEVIEQIPSTKSKSYLKRLPRYPAYPLSKRFPHASPLAVNLLEKMLEFDPARRIVIEDALAHPYLSAYHSPANEPNMPPFDFDFDRRCVSLSDIKKIMLYRDPRPETPLAVQLNHLQISHRAYLKVGTPEKIIRKPQNALLKPKAFSETQDALQSLSTQPSGYKFKSA